MEKNNQQHPAVLVVLISQITLLATVAFAEHIVRHNRWVEAGFGFSFLFGLIVSVGFLGMYRERVVEWGFWGFLLANPLHMAVAIATAGQIVTILLV
jgi:hypothetical protein